MSSYRTAQLDDVAAEQWPYWAPIRHHLDIRTFGINAWRGQAGDEVIKRHDESESGQPELYLVLSGHDRQHDTVRCSTVTPLPDRCCKPRQILRPIDAQPDAPVAHVCITDFSRSIEQRVQPIAGHEHERHARTQLHG